jgi:hypothetical protein
MAGLMPMARLFVWLALAACGGASQPKTSTTTSSPPRDPTADARPAGDVACQPAVDAMFAVTAANEPADLRARAAKVFVASCEADRWSAEARSCMAAVKVPADGDTCERLLTAEQKRTLADVLSKELTEAGVPPETTSGKPQPAADAKDAKKAEPRAAEPAAAPPPAKPAAPARSKSPPKASKGAPGGGRTADPCEGGE